MGNKEVADSERLAHTHAIPLILEVQPHIIWLIQRGGWGGWRGGALQQRRWKSERTQGRGRRNNY